MNLEITKENLWKYCRKVDYREGKAVDCCFGRVKIDRILFDRVDLEAIKKLNELIRTLEGKKILRVELKTEWTDSVKKNENNIDVTGGNVTVKLVLEDGKELYIVAGGLRGGGLRISEEENGRILAFIALPEEEED